MEYLKICRIACKHCGEILERFYSDPSDYAGPIMWCSCGKVGLNPAPYFWKAYGDIEDYLILHEFAEKEDMRRMILRFDDEKARALGYTAQACYDVMDRFFARYGIKPTSQGVYEAPDNQNTFDAFGRTIRLPDDTTWFLKVVSLWIEYNDYDMPEDYLASYYEFNNKKRC
ncbi:MAG: hypothetical protein IKB86_07075 [Clostridia bacterium]|nr:hypothetical protein [Clostridia bacterium]